jgi:hypothetical protein
MYKTKNLLTVGADAKTVKGQKYGFLTGILYLSPAKSSGYQVCPMARLAQCEAPCLNWAGRGAMNCVQKSRLNKTLWFFQEKETFMHTLVRNIEALVRKSKRMGLEPRVRLNGTSDIRWEREDFEDVSGRHYMNIMQRFPDVIFYDYTKDANRTDLPANYDLTFSYSGVPEFQPYVEKAMDKGMRMAVVWRSVAKIPQMFKGIQVVNGDNSDVRDMDEQGVIVGLYAKGKAKRDTSGFVLN